MKIRALLFGKNFLSFTFMLLTVVFLVKGIGLILTPYLLSLPAWLSFVLGYSLQTLVFGIVLYFWFVRRFPTERKSIVFASPGIGKLFQYVIFIFISYFLFSAAVFAISEQLGFSKVIGFEEQPSLLDPIRGHSVGVMALFFIALFAAPIIEEYVFRGWGMICLPTEKYPMLAIFLNGLLFALLHGQPASIIPLIFLGCMIAWARIHSGSLLPGIIFHVINNSLAFLVDYWFPHL